MINNLLAVPEDYFKTGFVQVQTALTRRPPSTSMTRKYQSMAPIGLEIFGASTGTTVSSKGICLYNIHI